MANRLSPAKIEAYRLDFPQPHDAALVIAMGLDTERSQTVLPLLSRAGSQAKSEAVRSLIEHGDTDDLMLPILDSIQDQRQKAVSLARGLPLAARLNQRKELETLLGHPNLHPNSIRLALYISLEEKNAMMVRRLAEVMDLEKMRKYLLYRKDWACLEYLAELIPVAIATDWLRRHPYHFHHLRGLLLAQRRGEEMNALSPPTVVGRPRRRS